MVKRFKIYTLGCKVNQYDSGWLALQLQNIGFEIAKSDADLAVINTCAVTKTAIRKNRQIVNKAKNENPQAKIAIIGCWPKIYNFDANDLKVDLVINSRDLKDVINEIKNIFAKENFKPIYNHNTSVSGDKARYFIKIQDGCEQFCSYCIIPFARGKIKSRNAKEIIAEIKTAGENGYKEFVLTGIHLGLYGKDLGDINLVDLLKKITGLIDLGRIRLSSIEITEVSDELIKLMAGNKKICEHLHIPLQSGCDKILKLMNRPYDTNFFKERVEKIRKAMPDIALTTDVIIGFPGETEKDFQETNNFIKEINFSRLHVFPFSAHEKTKAYLMPDKVSDEDKKNRAKKLRELSTILEKKFKNKFEGKVTEALVEKKNGEYYEGKTEHYLDVKFKEKQLARIVDKVDLKVKNIVKIKI